MFWKKNKNYACFDDVDVRNIRRYTTETIQPIVDFYADWYAEKGVTLPRGFEQDPSGWTEVLRKIQRAFILASNEDMPDGEVYKAVASGKLNEVEKLEGEIQEGFELFGKYLNSLVDNNYREK